MDNKGLYVKYAVHRLDGKDIGQCFVLELDDEKTWPALLVWAQTVEVHGNLLLADDIRRLVQGRQANVRRTN